MSRGANDGNGRGAVIAGDAVDRPDLAGSRHSDFPKAESTSVVRGARPLLPQVALDHVITVVVATQPDRQCFHV